MSAIPGIARRLSSSLVVVVATLGLLRCGNEVLTPGAPGSSHELVPGDTVLVDLAGSAGPLVFSFRPDTLVYATLFVQAATGAVEVTVRNSASVVGVAFGAVASDSPAVLLDNRTGHFAARPGRTYLIELDQPTAAARGRSRVVLHLIDRRPERVARVLSVGDTVAGEQIDLSADIDDFTLAVEAAQEVIAFLEAPVGFRPGGLLLGVYPDVGLPYGRVATGSVRNAIASTEFEALSSGRFTLQKGGEHYVTVISPRGPWAPASAHVGRYRFAILPIHRDPERLVPTVTAGDTVAGEAVDHVGDIDEFLLSVPPGGEVNIFFQAASGPPLSVLRLETVGPGPVTGPVIRSKTADTTLAGQATGTIQMSPGTPLLLRVSGESDTALDRGAYRLFAYPIERAPETAAATLVPGDSVIDEQIDLPGDIDEYTLTLSEPSLLSVWITRNVASAAGPGLRMEMHEAASGNRVREISMSGVFNDGVGTGAVLTAPGAYRLRMIGSSLGTGFRGPYRLFTGLVDTLPEGIGPMITVGDTIAEALIPLGDTDIYRVQGRRGQVLDIPFQGAGDPSPAFELILTTEPMFGLTLATVYTHFGTGRSGRFILPATASYRLTVSTWNEGELPQERGPYRFALVELPTEPEVAASQVLPGDSVNNERLDFPGDVDDFLLAAPPGAELQTVIFNEDLVGDLMVEVQDHDTYEVLRSGSTTNLVQREATGLVAVPMSGVVRLRVYEPGYGACGSSDCAFRPTARYDLTTYLVSRTPESLPALVAVGDTVIGEAIDRVGDIDDFEFDGTAGDTVEVYFQTPNGFGSPPALLRLMDPVTDTVLGSVTSGYPTTRLEDQTTGAVVLPRSDRFRVRISGESDHRNFGPYRFRVRLAGG